MTRTLMLCALLALPACADHSSAGAGGSAGTGSGGVGGTSGAGGSGTGGVGGTGGGSAPFVGGLDATRTRTCAGDCVDLTATASGGVTPYAYTWSPGVGEGAGPARVCPSVTTTYEITIADASIAFENTERNPDVHASVTIEVVDSAECVDSGTPPSDAGIDAGHEGPRDLCTLRRVSGGSGFTWSPIAGQHIAIDSRGYAILALQFKGSLMFHQERTDSAADSVGLLAAIDQSCNVVWARVFDGGINSAVRINAVAVDDEDNILIGGAFYGAVNLGFGTIAASTAHAFVTKLDKDGTTQWVRNFASAFAVNEVLGLAVTPMTREVTLIGQAGFDTSFGGPPIGVLSATALPFLARLTQFGTHIWSRTFSSPELRFTVVVEPHGNGDIYVNGWSGGAVSFTGPSGTSLGLGLGTGSRYLAWLDLNGEPHGLGMLPRGDNDIDAWNWWTGDIAVMSNHDVIISRDEPETQLDSTMLLNDTIGRYREVEETLWERRLSTRSPFNGQLHALAVDLDNDAIYRLAQLDGPVTFIGGHTGAPIGDSGIALIRISGQGDMQWLHMLGNTHWNSPVGLAARAGKIAVAYVAGIGTDTDSEINVAWVED